MGLQGTFDQDLLREKLLAALLDGYYQKHLKHYNFERITQPARQFQGVDIQLTHKGTGQIFLVDEKAQLDYVNEELPTFAFELSYEHHGKTREGWLFDPVKTTQFYALITAIYADAPHTFTSCKITFVNRAKLLALLQSRGLDKVVLNTKRGALGEHHGKVVLENLCPRKEGYLYLSRLNKAEKPCNLVLRLGFLEANGLAKRLV